MIRILLSVSLLMLLTACAHKAALPVAAPEKAAAPAVEALPPDAVEPPLLAEQLHGVLGVRDYRFSKDGAIASLSVVMENLRADEPVVLELAARFEDAQGRVVSETSFVRATIQPRGRHPYEAAMRDPTATGGKILVRLVEKQTK